MPRAKTNEKENETEAVVNETATEEIAAPEEAPAEGQPTEAPAEEAPAAEETPADEAPEAEPTDGADEVTIYDPNGNPHRTYSRERHGDNFRALAKEYLSSRPGWTAR